MNLPRVSVQRGPLSKASVTYHALMRSLLLMYGGDMLRQVELEVKAEATGRARIRARPLVDSSAMLEHGGPLSKGLSTAITCEISPLQMHSSEMAVLGADMSESGRTLLALKRLELLVNGSDVQA